MVPSFAESREYQILDDTERPITGVVFSTFAKFMEASYANRAVIEECVRAIEHFASMNDPEAENYLVTEVFEAFRQPEVSKNLLLPMSKALYQRWIGD
jgi:hypothetical protein